MSNYHHSASCLQDLLSRLNDLAVAEQLIAEALPGRKGKRLAGWLAAQTESLLPEFSRALNDFQQQRALAGGVRLRGRYPLVTLVGRGVR